MEQLAARRAHNPKVGGSSPPPATKADNLKGLSVFCFHEFLRDYPFSCCCCLRVFRPCRKDAARATRNEALLCSQQFARILLPIAD